MAVSFDLDGDVVLYVPHSADLLLLNPAASLIWLALEDGCDTAEAAALLSEAANIPLTVARKDCERIVREWQEQSLFDTNPPAPKTSADGEETWWPQSVAVTATSAPADQIAGTYRLADFEFVLRSADSEQDRAVHEFLSHLAIGSAGQTEHLLELVRMDSGWQLIFNGRLIDACDSDAKLVPMIHRTMMVVGYRGSDAEAAIHAAALTCDECCVLLAGTTGNGKSTLTAGLMANGFEFVSDDMVLLTSRPIEVRGVPMRLSLKDGSWQVVQPLWPELTSVPVHQREDGRLIRYFRPAGSAAVDQPAKRYVADILIFPRYRENASLHVARLGTAQALMLLAEAGYDFADVMTEDLVRDLIDWISGLRCFQLEYSDLADAIGEVRRLIKDLV